MPTLPFLSEGDVTLLQGLLDKERRRPVNTSGRYRADPTPQAPEVYIARTPAAGIMALAEQTGTGILDDPGYADCFIYRIIETGGISELEPVSGLFKRVYNLSTDNIPGETWIPIVRDKFGSWLAMGLGEGGVGVVASGAFVYNTLSQPIAYNVLTTLAFNSELRDTDGYHSITVNSTRLTALTTDWYHVGASVEFDDFGLDSGAVLQLVKNSDSSNIWSEDGRLFGARVLDRALTISADIFLNAGDFVELRVHHRDAAVEPSGNLNVKGVTGNLYKRCSFWIDRLTGAEGGGISGWTLREVDLVPTIINVNELLVNQDDGFEAVGVSAGVGRLNFLSTGGTQKGAVSLTDQMLGKGIKSVDKIAFTLTTGTTSSIDPIIYTYQNTNVDPTLIIGFNRGDTQTVPIYAPGGFRWYETDLFTQTSPFMLLNGVDHQIWIEHYPNEAAVPSLFDGSFHVQKATTPTNFATERPDFWVNTSGRFLARSLYAINQSSTVYNGAFGADPVGNIFKGGICTTVGSTSPTGAPTDAQYVVLELHGSLTAERRLQVNGSLGMADGGMNGDVTLSVNYANPTALVGLAAVNGAAVTAMRSDAAPAIDQSIAPTWTGLHTYNRGTVSQFAIILDMALPTSVEQRDSHVIMLKGTSYDSAAHHSDWWQYVDITSNAGASSYVWRSRIDTGSLGTRLTLGNDGLLTVTNRITNLTQAIGTTDAVAAGRLVSTTEGIQGGGDMTADRIHKLDINGLTEDLTPDSAMDFVATYDTSAGLHKKVKLSSIGGGGGVSFADPTALVGLTMIPGSGTNAMRANAAPALNQTIAPTWTGIHTWNPGTTQDTPLQILIAQPSIAGQRDSHMVLLRGTSFDTTGHNADWRYWVNVTSDAGLSTFTLETRIDGASFLDVLAITNPGVVTGTLNDDITSSISTHLLLKHNTSGVVITGYGSSIDVQLESSTTLSRDASSMRTSWVTETDASRASRLALFAYSVATSQEGLRIEGNSGGVRLGFYGATAVAKPTITGDRFGNTALASLLTNLAGQGLLIDSTTPGTGGGTIVVREVDLAPSYSGISTVEFDQVDGFIVSNPSPGIARVDMSEASGSTVGIVNLAGQILGQGVKTVSGLGITYADGTTHADDPIMTAIKPAGMKAGLLLGPLWDTFHAGGAVRWYVDATIDQTQPFWAGYHFSPTGGSGVRISRFANEAAYPNSFIGTFSVVKTSSTAPYAQGSEDTDFWVCSTGQMFCEGSYWVRRAGLNYEGLDGTMVDGSVIKGGIVTTIGSGSAPATASYVVMGLDGSLTADRRLQVGSSINMADGGINSDVTLSVVYANPSALVGLAANNGTATSAMRSDATPALDQGIIPTWTGTHRWNSGTSQTTMMILDMAQPSVAGQRDSHVLQFRGTSFDSAGHNADWQQYVDVTSDAGASTFLWRSRIDAAGYANRMTLGDGGLLTVTNRITGLTQATGSTDAVAGGRTFTGGTGITINGGASATLVSDITVALSTPVSLTNGGTGASLTDPNADRLVFWDDSAGSIAFLTIGTGLSLTDTTITATGGGTGAPSSSQYVVLSLDTGLSAERVLVAGSGLTLTDSGANGDATLAVGAGTGISIAADTVLWAPENYVGNVILWDGTQASRTLTFFTSGAVAPVLLSSDNSLNLAAGVLKQGGTNVVLETRTLTGGTGINTIGDLSANRTVSVNQSFSPVWTGVHTFNPGGASQATPLQFLRDVLGGVGQYDSHMLLLEGRAYDTTNHVADWVQYVDVTSDAGASSYVFRTRIDIAGFATKLSIADTGAITVQGKILNLTQGTAATEALAAGRSITCTEGIQTTGADLTADRTHKLDINGLVEDTTPDSANDFLTTYDFSAGLHKKVRITNLPTGTGAPAAAEYLVLTLHALLSDERVLVAGGGLTLDPGSANGNATLAVGAGMGIAVNANDLAWSPQTYTGNITFWDGSAASFTLTANVSGTDSVITFGSSSVDVTTGTLKQGGTPVVLESRVFSAGTGLTGGGDFSANRSYSVVADTTVQRVAARKNSTGGDVGARRRLNLIEGGVLGIAIADDAGADNELDITLTVSSANPTALIGLAAVNGSATTLMRSDGAPALDQAIIPTWTGTHTFNTGTSSTTAVFLTMSQPSIAGQRDSHVLLMRGTSFDTSGHNADWQSYVDVTSDAATSSLLWRSRIDGAGFATRMTLGDGGLLTVTNRITGLTQATTTSDAVAAGRLVVAGTGIIINGSTSANLTSDVTIAIDSTVVTLTGVQTLSNKTLTNSSIITIRDANFVLQNNADTTKQAFFSLSGITTGTLRTYTLPNEDGTFVLTSRSVTAGTGLSGGGALSSNITISLLNPVSLALGGTGAALADPNADRIMFWDDSATTVTWLTAGTGLAITGTTLDCTVVGASFANPTALVGLSAVNGVAITAMRSDAAPALDQAIAPSWTSTHTFIPGTSSQTAVFLSMAQPGAAGQRDSHVFLVRGTSFDSSGHNADWQQYVDVTSDAAASSLLWRSRVDAAAFATRLTIEDSGLLRVTNRITGLTQASGTTDAVAAGRLLIGGTGITVNGTSSANLTGDVTIASTVSGGAPTDAEYLVLNLHGSLTAERVLVGGAGLTLDPGAVNGSATLAVGAGTGITVNANDVAITVPVTVSLGGTGSTSFTSGRILYGNGTGALGNSSDFTWDDSSKILLVQHTAGQALSQIVSITSTNSQAPRHQLFRYRAGVTSILNGDYLGILQFSGYVNATFMDLAEWRGVYAGGGTDQVGDMVCFLANGGAPAEKFRVAAAGTITVQGKITNLTQGTASGEAIHAGRQITCTEGIQTDGANLTADRTHKLNVNGLTEDTSPVASTDFVATWDADAGVHKKVKLANLGTGGGAPTNASYVVIGLNNTLTNERVLTAGSGLTLVDGLENGNATLSITAPVSIANGGTNSTATLNNSRVMISSGGAIIEHGAMSNGQLLIGSTGAGPNIAGLGEGTGIDIAVGAGTITISMETPVSLANGGTGQALTDPEGHRILFWNNTSNIIAWMQNGNGITFNPPNLDLDITNLGQDTVADRLADLVVIYDTSAGAHKKMLMSDFYTSLIP